MLFNMNIESKKRFCLMQAITLILSIVFMMLSAATSGVSAKAIGKIEDAVDADFTAYTFDELVAKGFNFPEPDKVDSLQTTKDGLGKDGRSISPALYYNLKNKREYAKWYNEAQMYMDSSFKNPLKNDSGYYRKTQNGNTVQISEDEAWLMYESVANKMTMIMARGASNKMVGDVFGQEFDPTNAVSLAAMRTFTLVCNATFNVIAKALMLLFLVQTGFDVLYLVIPALQPLLAPANASSGGGSAGLAQGKKFALRFNVVSNEAVEANNRGATGSVGSNGGTGGGFLQTNIAARYLIARAPLIIIAFTYFVLVATNVWTSIITWTTSVITGFFYGL